MTNDMDRAVYKLHSVVSGMCSLTILLLVFLACLRSSGFMHDLLLVEFHMLLGQSRTIAQGTFFLRLTVALPILASTFIKESEQNSLLAPSHA